MPYQDVGPSLPRQRSRHAAPQTRRQGYPQRSALSRQGSLSPRTHSARRSHGCRPSLRGQRPCLLLSLGVFHEDDNKFPPCFTSSASLCRKTTQTKARRSSLVNHRKEEQSRNRAPSRPSPTVVASEGKKKRLGLSHWKEISQGRKKLE